MSRRKNQTNKCTEFKIGGNMLFVHDHKFCIHNGNVYTAGSLTDELFKRYEDIFGDVIVFANKVAVSDNKDMPRLRSDREMYLYEKRNILGFKKLKTIRKLVKKEKYVVLRLPSINGILVGLSMLLRRKSYMVEVVGCSRDAFSNHGLSGKILMPIITFFTKLLTKKASYALYVTDVFLQDRYPTNGISIGCSDVLIDEVFSVALKDKKDKGQQIIIGTAGAIDVRYKGQEFVIEAISELKKHGIYAEYRLAGSGTGAYLRQKACDLGVEEQVKFCGLLDRSLMNKFYSDLDIYIQPSLTEGMPRALIEAMSRGCYCTGSNVGGIPELVGNANCFNKADVADIVLKIGRYYDDVNDENRINCINRSKDFNASVLKSKREKFYTSFKSYVDSKNKDRR